MIQPVTIDRDAIYDDDALNLSIGLSRTALAKARREGSLRYTRQGHRVVYLGQWIIDWLDSTSRQGMVDA